MTREEFLTKGFTIPNGVSLPDDIISDMISEETFDRIEKTCTNVHKCAFTHRLLTPDLLWNLLKDTEATDILLHFQMIHMFLSMLNSPILAMILLPANSAVYDPFVVTDEEDQFLTNVQKSFVDSLRHDNDYVCVDEIVRHANETKLPLVLLYSSVFRAGLAV
jgi:hypothetical protein